MGIRHETAPDVTGRGRLVSAVSCLLLRGHVCACCANQSRKPGIRGRTRHTVQSSAQCDANSLRFAWSFQKIPRNVDWALVSRGPRGGGGQHRARQVSVAYVRWWMPLSPDTFWACRAQRRQLGRCARMPCKHAR